MSEKAFSSENSELIYGLHDRPPILEALFVALQHLLSIFVAIITPPLIICGALGLDIKETSYLVSMALFVSGIATFIQCRKVGPVGSGLLCIQGTSFSFIGPIIAAGFSGGLALVFGTCLAGSFIEILLSRFIPLARRIITPLVSGIIVTLIGLSLIKVGIISCAGGFGAENFGSLKNLALAFGVLALIVLLNGSRNSVVRMMAIVIGLAAGYIAATMMGMVDFSALEGVDVFLLPVPFKYGLDFSFSAFVPIALVYLVTAVEAIGDLTANSMVSRQPLSGETYIKRISGGVLADGCNSAVASLFNSFPNSTFSQNNGVIQLTGVASRYIGCYIALFLVLLGMVPIFGGFFSLMPAPVLGGATLLMFGTVASAGIKIIASTELDRRAMMILTVSLLRRPRRGAGPRGDQHLPRDDEEHLQIGYHQRRPDRHRLQHPFAGSPGRKSAAGRRVGNLTKKNGRPSGRPFFVSALACRLSRA